MFNKKLSLKSIEILFILVVGLVPLLWYKNGALGLGHDMGFPLAPVDHFIDRLYTWTDRLGPFGSNAVQVLPGFFIHGLEAILSYTGLSLINVQKVTFILWFTLPGISMYTLVRFLHPDDKDYPLRLTASVFYMMNHYILQAWTIAERTKFSIVAALPLVVLIITRVFHNKESTFKNSLLLSLILFVLNGGEGIPLFISLMLVAFLTSLVQFFLSKENIWPRIKRLISFTTLSIIFWSLLNSYWLFPYLSSYNQTFGERFSDAWGVSGIVSWSQSISAHTSWSNLFRLRGIVDWYNNPSHPYANEFFSNYGLILINLSFPLLIIISILKIKYLPTLSQKARLTFLLLLLFAIPLSAGSHPPFGVFYQYLLVNLPGFGIFRSGFFKFGMIIWLSYSYLVASAINDLATRPKKLKLVLTSMFILTIFIYNYPFFTGQFFNYSKDRSTLVRVPDYVFDAKKELDQNEFKTRTLFIPNTDLRTEYIEYDWGYFSLNDLTDIMSRKSAITNSVAARSNEKTLITSALSEYIKFGTSNLIKFFGVDKVIVRNDFISPDYEGNPLSGITSSLVSSKDFTKVKSMGRWDLYSYKNESLPRIYSTNQVTFISSTNEDLGLAANLPDGLTTNSFMWTSFSNPDFPADFVGKYIIQAVCADCPPQDIFQIYYSTSKILIPGTRLYEVGKVISSLKLSLTRSPQARIDQSLLTSSSLISDLGKIQAEKNARAISIATRDISYNLNILKSNLNQINDQSAKNAYLKKVRFYISSFLNYESQWTAASEVGNIKNDLTNLEKNLVELITYIDSKSDYTQISSSQSMYQYRLAPPTPGEYAIYIHIPSQASQLKVSLQNAPTTATKVANNWYKTQNIALGSQQVLVSLPKTLSNTPPKMFAKSEVKQSNQSLPNIKFVALNQTKYLVSSSESGKFILGFNSRFDSNWTLRKIILDTDSYLSGPNKNYNQSSVIEYPEKDTHFQNDLKLRESGSKVSPSLILNGFSMGWVLDQSTSQNSYYLLEYGYQNIFYISSAISIISLILFVTIYAFLSKTTNFDKIDNKS